MGFYNYGRRMVYASAAYSLYLFYIPTRVSVRDKSPVAKASSSYLDSMPKSGVGKPFSEPYCSSPLLSI